MGRRRSRGRLGVLPPSGVDSPSVATPTKVVPVRRILGTETSESVTASSGRRRNLGKAGAVSCRRGAFGGLRVDIGGITACIWDSSLKRIDSTKVVIPGEGASPTGEEGAEFERNISID